MKNRTLSILIFLSTVINNSYGQNFTPITINNSQGVYNGEVIWFDFDDDNDLDFIITGQSSTNDLHTRIYQNNGNDSFDLFTVLGGYSETGLELMNLNKDQSIDLIINGRKIGAGNDPTSIYENNNASFEIDNSTIDFLLGGTFASVIARDWNNDLKEDIIISGINGFVDGNPNIETIFYTRDQNNDLISSNPINGGAYLSALELFDIDIDLDLDLIISGNDGDFPYQRTDVYINEDNNFVLSDMTLEPLQNTSLDVGDYNSDGYLDVVLVGYNEFLRDTTLLYKNVEGVLTGVENSGLNGHVGRGGSVQWGDYDNDGDLDLLFQGETSVDWSFEVMINNGNETFSHLEEENFQNLAYGSASWGDYDNDGDLDILTTGYVDVNNPHLIIYRNDLVTPNTPPSSPTNLTTNSFELNNVNISWETSSDNETNFNSLTYNLHVEDNESNIIFSSYADLESGFLKRVWQGNMGLSTTWQFNGLENGQYDAYIQSIDAGYKASPFSDPSTFFIGLPETPQNLSLTEVDDIQLTWEDISNNEVYFIIERKLGESGLFVKFDSVVTDTESFTDEKLPPSFTVNYQLQASNPNGVSDYSSVVSSTIDGTPTELSLSMVASGIKLDWVDNSVTEEYFIIERKLSGSDSFEIIDSVASNVTEFIDTDDLEDEVIYRIYSKNELGFSDYSTEMSIIILSTNSKQTDNINFYPNPFEESITIRANTINIKDSQIQIFDLEGRSVQFITNPIDNQSLQIILNNNSQVFFVMIKNDTKTHFFKVLKK